MTAPEREALVKALRHIAEHDFRVSHLAHTGDTANEAADMIEALSAAPAVTVTEGWKPIETAPKDGSRDREPGMSRPSIPPIKDRIHAASTIDPETGCWNWRRYKDKDGYGNIRLNTKLLRAHRASYEAFVGPILPGLTIDHLCRNTSCVNPQHLEPVTRHENLMRSNAPAAINAAKTHCLKGHILSGRNLHINPAGGRVCRTCVAEYSKRRRAASRGQHAHGGTP